MSISIPNLTSDLEKKCSDLIDKIVLLTEEDSVGGKRHYRFADVIYHIGWYWKESTEFILNNQRFQNSILRNYIEQCQDKNLNDRNKNYKHLLSEIIQNKTKDACFDLPEKNELVIHLRLGDYVEMKDKFLCKNYVDIIRHACSTSHIRKITFCTAFHYGNNITQGIWLYTDEKHAENIFALRRIFTEILENIAVQIDIKSSKNPDDDFMYMVTAEHFIADVGNFSKLIQEVRKYRCL